MGKVSCTTHLQRASWSKLFQQQEAQAVITNCIPRVQAAPQHSSLLQRAEQGEPGCTLLSELCLLQSAFQV